MALDRIDTRILAELQQNARLSNKELAARVDLAPSTCLERVRRLIDSGVITGAHAAVDPRALGIELQAMVGVRLQLHSRDTVEAFLAEMVKLPEVLAGYYLSGATDFLLHVAARDTDHLRDFVLASLTEREEVARVETSLIFDYARDPQLPDYSAAAGAP